MNIHVVHHEQMEEDVEKLQFSLFLISCSQGILNASLLSWILSPKECLFTCIFHSLSELLQTN